MDNTYNEVIMEKIFLGQDDVSFSSFNWAFIYHMTCCIFDIYLSITNNYITQYDVFKSGSRVDVINFSGTDAARIRLYMSTLKVRPYI